MCTLLVHVPLGPGDALVLGANRDEAFERPSDGPRWLARDPDVWGGQDREAGGTWLCARVTAPARIVAVLNRPPRAGEDPHVPAGSAAKRRSRGLLCLEAARAGTLTLVEREVTRQVEMHGSAPFNLFVADTDSARVAAYDGHTLRWATLGRGWHALTHGEPDDPSDTRVARVLAEAASFPADLDLLARILAENDGPGAPCRHGERYGTVSSTLVRADLAAQTFAWRYAAGPPCVTAYAALDVRGPS